MAGVGIGREHDEEMTIFNSAGLATIEYIERENVLGRVREKAPWFKSEWDKIEKDFKCVGTTYAIGLEGGTLLVKDKVKHEPFSDYGPLDPLVREVGLKKGVPIFPFHGIIAVCPALNATDEELVKIMDVIREALAEIDRRFLSSQRGDEV